MKSVLKTAFTRIFFFFTPYANSFEWKVNRFCRWVTSYRNKHDVEKRLLALMQENLIITSIWLEKKYKNYRYLTKSVRRKLYKNAELMKQDFFTFEKMQVHKLSNSGSDPRKELLSLIMAYFSPLRGQYTYKEGVSFGKLLTNPGNEKYVGDCNQIVTLYAAFYAMRFPIEELNIKLIPGHVCLRFRTDDVEATNGTWKHYDKFDYVAPITELVATNLLDISEAGEKTNSIDPEVFVKAAQLAALLSQKRDIVENNVRAAYHNLCVRALKAKKLERAYFYANKLNNPELLRACYSTEYNVLMERVSTVKTVQDAKTKKGLYKRMLELANLLHNPDLIASVEKILDQIRKAK